MQAVFTNQSINSATTKNVKRIAIHPKAEGGRGTIHLYDEDGKTLAIILLDSMDAAIFFDDPNLTPAQALLMPAPTLPKEQGNEEVGNRVATTEGAA